MKKRSKYRPKPVIINPMGYVMESMTPVALHDSFMVDLRLVNHMAMAALAQGTATKADVNALINALNVMESLWRLGFGEEYRGVVDAGLRALRSVGARGVEANKFVPVAAEMDALNTAMELHDAQLEVITVRDMERAVKLVHDEIKYKRATPIVVEEKA
jgi:DNA-binding FadR family transcriptional regulator